MSETFGSRLRDWREQRQIPLRVVADQTKIKLSLLDGLERGDVSHWPGGIFRRAFVRAYAQSIGLDPEVIVREFLELYPDPGEDVVSALANADFLEELNAGPAARLRAAIGATVRSLSRGAEERRPATPDPPQVPLRHVESPEPLSACSPAADSMVPQPAADDDGAAADSAPARWAPEADSRAEAGSFTAASFREEPPVEEASPVPAPSSDTDLEAVARLCTAMAQVDEARELKPLLEQAADILDAAGLVLWVWDPDAAALRATLAHGYSDAVLAQLPAVPGDADNATAAAFRRGQPCVVNGTSAVNGALTVPLLTSSGCGGVLAVELPRSREQHPSVRAAATIVAAQLSSMMRVPAPAAAAGRRLA